ELNFPTKNQLLRIARRRGISTEGVDVDDIVKEKPVQQLFGKPFPQRGKIATLGLNDTWQADLLDLKQSRKKNNDGFQAALIVTRVFDRKTFALPTSKEPKEVWQKFMAIVGKFGAKPKRLDVDSGNEFAAHFATRAQQENIEIHTRTTNPTADVNFLGVVDAAIQKVKTALFKDMVAQKSTKWVDKLQKAVDIHNKLPNDHSLYGNAPKDINKKKDGQLTDEAKVAQFRLRQDNGAALRQNSKQLEQRQQKLRDEGAFRVQLKSQTFQRGFKPRFGSTVYEVESINNNTVKSTTGRTFDISKVMPVAKGSKDVEVPKALVAGSETRAAAMKNIMAPFQARLKAYLADGPKTLKNVGIHMKLVPGFEAALTKARLNRPGGIKAFVQMFPDLRVKGGRGQNTVELRRYRITRKTPKT
ncbi:MAG: hypothetical protein VXV74_03845, partial [Pseudomonadota bacterium]|nr:hypothetical protein [Pseudomonadota bacterium]